MSLEKVNFTCTWYKTISDIYCRFFMICYPIHVKGKIDKAGILLWQIIMLTENWVLNTKERTISTQTDIMMKPFLIWINSGSSLRLVFIESWSILTLRFSLSVIMLISVIDPLLDITWHCCNYQSVFGIDIQFCPNIDLPLFDASHLL